MATARRLAIPASLQRWDVSLTGVKNGANTSFLTPELFNQASPLRIRVYWNGFRLREGVGNDYTVAESGGMGTGFNTVILVVAPRGGDQLTADYVAA